jgi:L-fuculose-phosphate aldolase
VTHAEWYAEIIDTYCKTLLIARQLRPELKEISPDKIADLLALKKKMGLPDARFATEAAEPDKLEAAVDDYLSAVPTEQLPESGKQNSAELDRLVGLVTEQVVSYLEKEK